MKSIIQPKRIAYSTEVLFHFACGECLGLWTISDDEGERVREFTCPHCKFSAIVCLPEVTTEVSGNKLNPPALFVMPELEQLELLSLQDEGFDGR